MQQLEDLAYPDFIVRNQVPRHERKPLGPFTLEDRLRQDELTLAPAGLPEALLKTLLDRRLVLPFPFDNPAFNANMAAARPILQESVAQLLCLPHPVYASTLDVLLFVDNRETAAPEDRVLAQVLPSKRLLMSYFSVLFFLRTLSPIPLPDWESRVQDAIKRCNEVLSDDVRALLAVIFADPDCKALSEKMAVNLYTRPPFSTTDPDQCLLANHFAMISFQHTVSALRVLQTCMVYLLGIPMEAAERYRMFTCYRQPTTSELTSSLLAAQQREQETEIEYLNTEPRKNPTLLETRKAVREAPHSWNGRLCHYYVYLHLELLLLPNNHALLTSSAAQNSTVAAHSTS